MSAASGMPVLIKKKQKSINSTYVSHDLALSRLADLVQNKVVILYYSSGNTCYIMFVYFLSSRQMCLSFLKF